MLDVAVESIGAFDGSASPPFELEVVQPKMTGGLQGIDQHMLPVLEQFADIERISQWIGY